MCSLIEFLVWKRPSAYRGSATSQCWRRCGSWWRFGWQAVPENGLLGTLPSVLPSEDRKQAVFILPSAIEPPVCSIFHPQHEISLPAAWNSGLTGGYKKAQLAHSLKPHFHLWLPSFSWGNSQNVVTARFNLPDMDASVSLESDY